MGCNKVFNEMVTKADNYVPIEAALVKKRYNDSIMDTVHRATIAGNYDMGSEVGSDGKLDKLSDITGTLLTEIDDLVDGTIEMDANAISPKHQGYLRGIFDKYKQVLTEAGKDVDFNLKVYQDLDALGNTRGEADPKTAEIKLVLGNQKNNTTTEVLAHEVQHILLRNAIKGNKYLQFKIIELREALKKHFDEKYKGEGWRVFTEGRIDADEADAKKKYEYSFNNDKYPVDEFLAYATTNEQLVGQLGLTKNFNYKAILPLVKETGRFTKVWNELASGINKAFNAYVLNKRNAHDLVIELLDKALEHGHLANKAKEQSFMDTLVDKISKVDEKIAKYTGQIEKEYKSYDDYLKSKKDDKLRQALDKIWKIRGLANIRSFLLQNNVFNSVTRDMNNPETAKFYEMFRKSKSFVEKEVVAVKNKTAKVLMSTYGFDKVKIEHRRSLKRSLIDADLAVLGDASEISKYLSDDVLVNKEIDKLSESLKDSTILAVDALADLLVSNTTKLKNGYTNAAQIALSEEGSINNDFIDSIDRLVSLVALTKLSDSDKKNSLEAIKSNPEGVNTVIKMKQLNEDKLLEKAYFGDRMYQVKGAKQEVYLKDKRHYIVSENEMKELVRSGMMNIGKNEEISKALGKDMYVVLGDSNEVAFTEGLMSVIQLKNEGDSLRRLLLDNGFTEEEATLKISDMEDVASLGKSESLIPERSGHGGIYDYRYRLPYEYKSSYMSMDDDIVSTMASTISNLTHKQEAMLNNRAAIIYLNDFYKSYKNSSKYKFVEISADSKGKLKDYWESLPFYLKREINRSNKKLMIEEGMLVDFFGYKDASLVNAPWIKDRVKRQIIAKKFEKIVNEVTKNWKKHIVALTPKTIYGNMLSNMFVALQHTKNKNPITYMEKFKEVWGMMNTYQADREKLLELEIRMGKAGDSRVTQKQIDALKVKMKTNPISIIIDDGQYNAILEDIDSDFFNHKGIIEEKIDNAINSIRKDKSRANVKALIDNLYIRKDSRFHDSVMKLTNYADAINKMIILMDIMERNNGKYNQKDLNMLDQLHVNYGYLDNRYIKYANDMGFLSFTKYFFRVFPAMVKMIANKAFTVGLTESAIKLTGFGETPLKPFYNPFNSLARKVSTFSDPVNYFETLIIPHVL